MFAWRHRQFSRFNCIGVRSPLTGLTCILFFFAGLAHAEICSAAATPTLETILVTGDQPGPGLWKVSKGDHVLWILGYVRPLPKNMKWRPKMLESTIASSQEVLGLSRATLGVNLFSSLPVLAAWHRMRKLPEGQRLVDVLSPQLFAQWTALKAKYLGSDAAIERLRPRYAAAELFKGAIDRSGLTNGYDVWDVVKGLARKHRIRIVTNDFKIQISDPRTRIEELEHAPASADLDCMASTLERLEKDLPNMRLRANAWATGDIQALHDLAYVDQEDTCLGALANVNGLGEPVQQLKERLANDWMQSAGQALDQNQSTVAVLALPDLFSARGRLARLREKGYLVEEPQDLP
jgi:hypothetical protein